MIAAQAILEGVPVVSRDNALSDPGAGCGDASREPFLSCVLPCERERHYCSLTSHLLSVSAEGISKSLSRPRCFVMSKCCSSVRRNLPTYECCNVCERSLCANVWSVTETVGLWVGLWAGHELGHQLQKSLGRPSRFGTAERQDARVQTFGLGRNPVAEGRRPAAERASTRNGDGSGGGSP